MSEEMNIHQKLVEIRKSIDTFTKDTKGHQYEYVSGSQVLSKIKGKMDELGVLLEPEVKQVQHDTTGKSPVVHGEMVYTWVNADKPDDRIEKKWMLFGQQADVSKAFGSALTYSERYFLLKYFGIPTDDDDPDTQQQPKKATDNQKKMLNDLVNKRAQANGSTPDQTWQGMLSHFGLNATWDTLTQGQCSQLINALQNN
ncbi:ERF superfamily protein [Salsuginibacillus halophilus]|uniref:ERF superfamily protein n=1 Tax=Salsuginibacillus halophilus TaxID=517424 RepID=A0A2P8H6D1_9BACI|nr:ERF family protein [Salsuginibacillus halophilus]PSL41744.1 ERF superfamily protein [Salsuginibacillus halophilus]